MPVDRPTFSESWYRVAELRPRLISTVQVHRQHFRGRTWHVLQDPASNQFFRLNEAAYRFVALLDGRRSVAEVWDLCNEQLGDDAPTQGEAIQLLGQLYTSNLLSAELAPDAQGLFNRHKKRVTREVQGYLMNLLFVRIPLFDPDRLLDRWIGVFGWLFSWAGAILWLALMATAGYFLIGRFDTLVEDTTQTFAQMNILNNLPLLYASLVLIKVTHEFGHAFACKKFGRDTGTGGEVHVMGVMFLVFTPLPYVDASSSWAFRKKWHRMVVGMGGMFVETAIAAVAAVVWARTGPGLVHDLAYNMIFIAGVSTILFNANPLLRYDGYYILSDLLEMPNLSQRSKQYLYYLVKRHVYGVRRAISPANSGGEKFWLLAYGIASTAYRVVICTAILLFIADRLFMLGIVLAAAAVVAWVLVPLGKFLHYLATSGELMRVRARAVVSTVLFAVAVVVGIGMIDASDRVRGQGFTDWVRYVEVRAAGDGWVRQVLPTGRQVSSDDVLLRCDEPTLQTELDQVDQEIDWVRIQQRIAECENNPLACSVYKAQIASLLQRQQRLRQQIGELTLRPPLAGEWICPQAHRLNGAYVRKGDQVGLIAQDQQLLIRVVVGQDDARLIEQADPHVELRVRGRPDLAFTGRVHKILPIGQDQLPNPALGTLAGGPIPVDPANREGTQAAERFFEIQITPDADSLAALTSFDGQPVRLRGRQFVVARFTTPSRPLAVQWWRSLQQLVQRRFHI